MRTLLFLLLPVLFFESCCLTSGKCDVSSYTSNFRIVSRADSSNLLFGPTARYDNNSVQFYSLQAGDTIFHPVSFSTGSLVAGDTVLYVSFWGTSADTVFVKLAPTDVDTLILRYNKIKPARCCGSNTYLTPLSFNGTPARKLDGGYGVWELMK